MTFRKLSDEVIVNLKKHGISRTTYLYRIDKYGWDKEKAMTTPPLTKKQCAAISAESRKSKPGIQNDYHIIGDICYLILNKRNGEKLVALIDAEDVEKLKKWRGRWSPRFDPQSKFHYITGSYTENGIKRRAILHRLILNPPPGKQIDHKNHDPLDNRKCNLSIVDAFENCQNRRKRSDNKSGYTGVHFSKHAQKWRARITVKGERIALGDYENLEDAIKARKEAEIKHFEYKQGIIS